MHKEGGNRKRLKDVIPRQMFEIPIQIMLGSKIIARESVKAFRKNVTAKLMGDVTRKKTSREAESWKKEDEANWKVHSHRKHFELLSTDRRK